MPEPKQTRYRPYPAYPAYKNYTALGIQTLPLSWELKRVKHLFRIGRGRVISEQELVDDGIYPVFSSQTHNNGCLGYINTFDFDRDQITWTTDGANAGTVFIRKGRHNCTNVCGTLELRNKSCSLKFFLYYLHYVTAFHKRPDTNGAKIMNNEMAEIAIASPPLPEQTQIAAFLDHETAQIDALIAKQQRLIALLEEKRQAVISHAVTKGLNPDAPLRPSGIDWLGDVPAHWEVKKFSHCTSIRSGQVDPRKAPYSEFTLIAPNHIQSGTGKIITLETASDQGADSGKYLSGEGEVIYSKIRPALAKACIAPSDMTICSADMYSISGTNGLTNKFLFWNLLSEWFTALTILESDRVAMPKINREKLAEVSMPIPPHGEQVELCKFIETNIEKLDALNRNANSAITLLKERRTALISAAVTGKIDVRDWTPPEAKDDAA